MGKGNDTKQTSRKRYFSGGYIVGAWSAFVQLQDGYFLSPSHLFLSHLSVVTKLEWADGCEECNNAAQCIDNMCGLEFSEFCKGANTEPCDIKIYLGWKGYDAAGWPSTSVGELPPNYSLLTWGNMHEQAALVPQGEFNV